MIEAPVFEQNESRLPREREIVGSRAFNLEYFSYTSKEEMYDDVVSYLGEYRFQLKKYDYEMVYAQGEGDVWAIRDTARGESLHTKAARVLEERKYRGDPINRETQEEIGVRKLDEQLKFAKTGDKIRWMSPPGEASEGYDTYGFIYEGDVVRKVDGSLALHMSAMRLEGEIESYNKAFEALTGSVADHAKAEEFLSDPRLIRGDSANISDVLRNHFGFSHDAHQDQDFQEAIRRVAPLIHEVIDKIKTGSKQEKVTAFNTLENYFLKQKKNIREERESQGKVVFIESYRHPTLDVLRGAYGHDAPVARGSCGSTSKSSNLTIGGGNQIDNFLKKNGVEEEGCGCMDKSDNHYHCPKESGGCGKKYSDETQKSADDRTKKCGCGFKFGC